jgi:hypothetical protein
LALLTFFTLPAFAQYTRDAAASKKIDEAINEHYLATDFDKAEQVLTGTVSACADKCSPAVLAKAWMYVGIVRGSGKNDQAGAKDAFQKAIASDPTIKLDVQLATPETQKTFSDLSAGGAGAAAAAVAAPAAAANEDAGDKGGVKCTPDVRELQTLRPIPFECSSDEDVASMEIRYKSFGSEEWKAVKMKKVGDAFRGEVPCDATGSAGTLRLYVRAKDATGESVDSFGTKSKPVEFTALEASTAAPPSYPGEAPPARCVAKEECPPDFPGCSGTKHGHKAWGEPCDNTAECKEGLLCGGEGTCESPPSCETNADCESGVCNDNKCGPAEGSGASSSKYKKNWFGLHFAQDIAIIGGTDVCSKASRENDGYSCFLEGTETPYLGNPYPGAGISTGTVIATRRLLLSFDRALNPNLTLGARLGFAFSGGPAANGKSFLPFHGELRLAYWFGKAALAKKGLRPYVHAGGGIAQVDGRVKVKVADCEPITDNAIYNQCIKGEGGPPVHEATTPTPMDVWRKMGQGFATFGGGLVYAFTPTLGAQLNLNLMVMLPTAGFVMQPSLGIVYGL